MAKRVQRVVVRKKKKLENKKRLSRFTFLAVTGVLSFAAMFFCYEYLPGILKEWDALKIKKIDIECPDSGERLAAVKEFFSGWKNTSVFELKKSAMIEELAVEFPEYKINKCRYVVPNGLKIDLKMRQGLCCVNLNEEKCVLDVEGIAYSRGSTDDLPEIIFADEESKLSLLRFLKIWNESGFKLHTQLRKIAVRDNNEVELFLEDGTKITWGEMVADKEDMTGKFDHLKAVLDDALRRYGDLRYVNMRYLDDGRILIKPVQKKTEN